MRVSDDAHQEMAEKRLETIKSLLGTAWRSIQRDLARFAAGVGTSCGRQPDRSMASRRVAATCHLVCEIQPCPIFDVPRRVRGRAPGPKPLCA